MNKETILGVVRHVLTFGGGFLVAKGIADASMVAEATSAIVTLIGVAWSIHAKKKSGVIPQ